MSTETDNTYDIDCNDENCPNESCQMARARHERLTAILTEIDSERTDREAAEKNAGYVWVFRNINY